MAVAYSDVPKPETNPTDLLASAEHNAAPPLVPIDAPSAVQRPWEEDRLEDISASFKCAQHRWASGENRTESPLRVGSCQRLAAVGGNQAFDSHHQS